MRDRFVLFLGAGASRPLSVPTSVEFVPEFLKKSPKYSELWDMLASEVRSAGYGRELDLEATMTLLDAISSQDPLGYLEEAAEPVLFLYAGAQLGKAIERIGMAYGDQATKMSKALRNFVRDRCLHPNFQLLNQIYDPLMAALGALAERVGVTRASHKRGLVYPQFDCFTTNYDLAFERYCRGLVGPQLRTGFREDSGSLAFSVYQLQDTGSPYLVLPVHGSVAMMRLADSRVVRSDIYSPEIGMTSAGEQIEGEVMIYPVLEKQRTRYPFPEIFSAFSDRVRESPVVVFVGFSFRDAPILDLLRDSSRDGQLVLVISQSAKDVVAERVGTTLRSEVIPVSVRLGDSELDHQMKTVRPAR